MIYYLFSCWKQISFPRDWQRWPCEDREQFVSCFTETFLKELVIHSGQRNDSILSHPPFTDTVHLPGMHAAFAIKHRIIKGEFSSTTMWVHPCNSTMPLLPYIRSQHDSSSKSLVGNGFWRLPEISHPVPRIKSSPEVRIKAKAPSVLGVTSNNTELPLLAQRSNTLMSPWQVSNGSPTAPEGRPHSFVFNCIKETLTKNVVLSCYVPTECEKLLRNQVFLKAPLCTIKLTVDTWETCQLRP